MQSRSGTERDRLGPHNVDDVVSAQHHFRLPIGSIHELRTSWDGSPCIFIVRLRHDEGIHEHYKYDRGNYASNNPGHDPGNDGGNDAINIVMHFPLPTGSSLDL